MPHKQMKQEYDFSKGERGKFFREGVKLHLPIYLDLNLQNQLERFAQKQHKALSDIVQYLLKKELRLVQS